jgi:hypothetical protein
MESLLEHIEGMLEGWADGHTFIEALEDEFPSEQELKEIFEMYSCAAWSKERYEEAMIRLLNLGKVGMDGFKYCWPERAIQNRRIFLANGR